MSKIYKNTNVLEAAQKRIAFIFDEFKDIVVSISGGKDSTVLAHLMLVEAHKRNRKIRLFFLDEEAVYDSTVEQIRYLMNLHPENTIPMWYQIEFVLTNANSADGYRFMCWESEKEWMRAKEPNSIKRITWNTKNQRKSSKYGAGGLGFYTVLRNIQNQYENACFCVGIRGSESLDRYRAVTTHAGYKSLTWFTKGNQKSYTAYPLYDWEASDVWKYLHENNIKYSPIYDYMYKKGLPMNELRVSSLIHEKSFKALVELPEFEPNTYNRLLKRAEGIRNANLYGKEKKLMQVRKLPNNFTSWRQYRDFLLETAPNEEQKEVFTKRFATHLENEFVARQQCRQLILNDIGNDLPINNKPNPRKETIKKWSSIL